MKTRIMAMVSAMMLTLGVAAQDTLQWQGNNPPSNYFSYHWQQFDSVASFLNFTGLENGDIVAFHMETPTPLTVYGIAVSMSTTPLLHPDQIAWLEQHYGADYYWSQYWDTTYKEVYEHVGIFEADPDSLRPLGEKLKVHINTTPVSYYLDLGLLTIYTLDTIPILPMYERYFSEPVTVADSFYLGRYLHAGMRVAGKLSTLEIILPLINNGESAHIGMAMHFDTTNTNTINPENCIWGYASPNSGAGTNIPIMFPILTPDSNSHDDTQDTIVPGGDTIVPGIDTTTAVRQADMLRRYTGVQPNPVRGKVQVVSSFGMTRVEVYDAAGKRRYEGEATGLVHTVNVEGWPAGTYLVRIHTPLGTATKKLIVRSE